MDSCRPSVLVTGMGVVSSIGQDQGAFTRSLFEGKSGVRRVARPAAPVQIGAEIEGFDFEALVGRSPSLAQAASRAGGRAPFTVQASICAVSEAWEQAGLQSGAVAPERVGLVVAGHNTTGQYQSSLLDRFARDPEYLSPRYALQYQDSYQLGVLSQIFGVRGEGFVCGGASASGAVGIVQGLRLIRAGVVDACLVVGVLADLSPMEWQGFHNIGAVAGKRFRDEPERACRPFDAQHEGFVYGQAAACLVLESADVARERGASGLAELMGGAIVLHATATSEPDIDGEVRAMEGALRDSGLRIGDIGYLNTHGSSSPLGDRAEIAAIEKTFGSAFPRLWLNATKGLTGHCLTSAGVVEAIATTVQMREGFLHADLNLEEPIHPRARFCGSERVHTRTRVAMSNSFGFSGINASLVLRRTD